MFGIFNEAERDASLRLGWFFDWVYPISYVVCRAGYIVCGMSYRVYRIWYVVHGMSSVVYRKWYIVCVSYDVSNIVYKIYYIVCSWCIVCAMWVHGTSYVLYRTWFIVCEMSQEIIFRVTHMTLESVDRM